MPVLAADLGMGERGFREWASDRNVRMGIFNGMSYASRADALILLPYRVESTSFTVTGCQAFGSRCDLL